MDFPQTPARTSRHDGWTPERKVRFLERLSRTGNVRVACAAVGLSHATAYRLRQRDSAFARGWSVALALARDVGIQALSERAIEGVEEPVYYRGTLVGRRRRYDNRLLLAHLARLDKLVDERALEEDLANYADPFACLADERTPADLRDEPSGPAATPALERVPAAVPAAAPVRTVETAKPPARGGEFFPRTMSPLSASPPARAHSHAPAPGARPFATEAPERPQEALTVARPASDCAAAASRTCAGT